MSSTAASVSVVIPAHNAESYLEEAITSVLTQSAPVAEVLVVDDGSTDRTGAIAACFGPPVIHLYQCQSGPGAARNRGIDAATGNLIAFLDADDLWTVDSIQARLAAMGSNPSLEAVFGEVEQFICDRLSAVERERLVLPRRRLQGFLAGSMLARHSLFDRVGVFPTQHRAGEFIAWYLKARRAGLNAAMLGEIVLRRRVHLSNLGRLDPDSRQDLLAILRSDLHSRREGSRATDSIGDVPSSGSGGQG